VLVRGANANWPPPWRISPMSSANVAQPEAQKLYRQERISVETPMDRIRHVVQAAFDGRRIVVFSGGATKAKDEEVLTEVRAIRDGGGFGSIIGRNAFQRSEARAKKLLRGIVAILAGRPAPDKGRG
jgi:class I fructose-bisphosphate aldolase